MKKIFQLFICLFLCASFAYAGPKVEFGDDGYMKFAFLGQPHYSFMDGAADEDDFFIRRARIIGIGQITDGIKVFFETDNDKHGKEGVSADTDIQDAFVDIRLGDSAHWVEMGLILLPFSFDSTSSAVTLLGIDYNAEVVKLTNSFVWRDYGAMLHGSFGDKFEYRIGAFDGYDSGMKNGEASLRVTGHASFALVGTVDKGWFFAQNKIGKDNQLVIGAGYDSQSDATVDAMGMTMDSDAWVVDMSSNFNLSDKVSLQLNAAYYDWDSQIFVGNTYFAEAGLTINQKVQLTAKLSTQDADGASDEISDFTGGIHYYFKGHSTRIGAEFRSGDSDDWTLVGVSFLL